MRLTSVSIVLEPGNIGERKITIIIERCSRSTSWGQISLFLIKEQIKDFFLFQCPVFWITLQQVISYCLAKEVYAFHKTIFTFLWFTCIWLWGSGFIKALCEGDIQCSSSVTFLRSFKLFGRWRCYFTFIQGTQGRISFWVDSRNVICWKCSQLESNTSSIPAPDDLVTFVTCLLRLYSFFMWSAVNFSSNSLHNFWINARQIL